MPKPRLHVRAVVTLLPLLVAACSSLDRVPVAIEGSESSMMRSSVKIKSRGSFAVDVTLERAVSLGPRSVRTEDVTIRGEASTLTGILYKAGGVRSERRVSRAFGGYEGPALALVLPPASAWWGDARFEDNVLSVGYPKHDGGVRLLRGRWLRIEDPKRQVAINMIEDPMYFLGLYPPDLDLLPCLALCRGSWQPGEERRQTFRFARPEGCPDSSGEARVSYRGMRGESAVFKVRLRVEGSAFPAPGDHVRFTRKLNGEVRIRPSGVLTGGEMKWETTLLYGDSVKDRFRGRVTLMERDGRSRGRQDFARLLELRLSDYRQFREAALQETLRGASTLVRRLRPTADIEDLRAVLWDEETDPEALAGVEDQVLSGAFAARMIEAQGALLVRLGIFDAASLKTFKHKILGGEAGPDWAVAKASTPKGMILLRPAEVGALDTVSHELAHIASARRGYLDEGRLTVERDGAPDPAWVDLDGYLAAWALEEAGAVVTEVAATLEAEREGRSKYLWTRWEPPFEDRTESADRLESLLSFVYARSPTLLIERHRSGEGLEDTLRDTWSGFSYQTKEVLFPRAPALPSRFWNQVRQRRPELERLGVTGATRLGAYLTRHLLVLSAGRSWRQGSATVRGLEDDVALHVGKSILWISRWANPEAALRFRDAIDGSVKDATIRVDGTRVFVTVGTVHERLAEYFIED